jgi:hypothetical protein
MCRAGDVLLLRFPFSDIAVSKRRPVVVLTDEDSAGDFAQRGDYFVDDSDRWLAGVESV